MENIQKWIINDTNLYTGLHTEQALLPRVAPLRFREKKFLIPSEIWSQNGLCGRKCHPAEHGKQQIQLLQQGTKILLNLGKQQIQLLQQVTTYTLSRVLQSCCKVNNKIQGFAGTISRAMRVQGEALFIVVSLAATLDLKGPRRGDVLAKRCSLL